MITLADRTAGQRVDARERIPLVGREMAHRVPQHGPRSSLVGVHTKGGSLRHRPAGQEHRSRKAKKVSYRRLEIGNHTAVAVDIRNHLSTNRRQQLRGPDQTIAVNKRMAPVAPGSRFLIHTTTVPARRPAASLRRGDYARHVSTGPRRHAPTRRYRAGRDGLGQRAYESLYEVRAARTAL
jgi:hypothetical protein